MLLINSDNGVSTKMIISAILGIIIITIIVLAIVILAIVETICWIIIGLILITILTVIFGIVELIRWPFRVFIKMGQNKK